MSQSTGKLIKLPSLLAVVLVGRMTEVARHRQAQLARKGLKQKQMQPAKSTYGPQGQKRWARLVVTPRQFFSTRRGKAPRLSAHRLLAREKKTSKKGRYIGNLVIGGHIKRQKEREVDLSFYQHQISKVLGIR